LGLEHRELQAEFGRQTQPCRERLKIIINFRIPLSLGPDIALQILYKLGKMSQNNNPNPTPRPGGLSLYANLLDPTNTSTPGSIAKAPVIFKNPTVEPVEEQSTTKKPQIDAGSFSSS